MTKSKKTGKFGSSRSAQCIAARVPVLYNFFGGLATVFPGTATELKWTKDEYSTSLSDFSLEAKLHATTVGS